MATRKSVHLSLDPELYKRSQAQAIMQDTKISDVVETLLRAWLTSGVPISKVRRVANGKSDEKYE